MNIKHIVTGISLLFLIPTILSATEHTNGARIGGESGYNYGQNLDANYYGGSAGNGSYVGGFGEYINPNPPLGSQPGMSDDSDELYNSYLESNASQGYFH